MGRRLAVKLLGLALECLEFQLDQFPFQKGGDGLCWNLAAKEEQVVE